MSNKTSEQGVDGNCPACGDSLRGPKPLAKIDLGKLNRNGWKQTGSWGLIHESCFRLAIGDPRAIDAIAAAAV